MLKTLRQRLWPRRLASQMVALVLLVLVLAFAISLGLLAGAHKESIGNLNQGQISRQYLSIVRLMESSDPSYYPTILRAARSATTQVSLDRSSALPAQPPTPRDAHLIERLVEHLGPEYAGRIRASHALRIKLPERELRRLREHRGERMTEHQRRALLERRLSEHPDKRPKLEFFSLSVQLADGQWLNLDSQLPEPPPLVPRQTLIFLLISAAALMVALVWMVRRLTRPLQALTRSADQLGRGQPVAPLAERGPEDLRSPIRAFNQMNERLQRYVSDRTRMLAALSHDLRTPITSMRLRVEMMPPGPDQQALLATLEEMQQMSEATLAFLREGSDQEASRELDLDAMLESLCDDLQQLGKPVHYHSAEPLVLLARPSGLKRALRNLVENAVQYGEQAEVRYQRHDDAVWVEIQDQGPGLSESDQERVFEPFLRLEGSRNRHTGGVGLGLSIARNLVRAHGGDIELHNTHPGLKVRVILPLGS
ncbi:ATP-binding protein [Ferrimonas marina]|uniref:histidine kinase n=1 Tax=Ferrimonas marina TaxID=299255 RepID=A0A1M5XYY5_9GAMM|nr:ATP-binding protein [Ferrimonas marina]SHI05025.1 Signal transduction histidine kinase [Ferrimonas marina]